MHILLLGGSNTGIKGGWADQLSALAPERGIENRFLGAVGSLYGLMALLKREREQARLPDVVVVEYALNDMLLIEAGMLSRWLIADALDAIADYCARSGIGLIFLCLEPRPGAARRPAIARVKKLYAAATRESGASILWLHDILPEVTPEQFQDENHLTLDAAGRVATALLRAIEAGAPTPRPGRLPAGSFDYVDATQADAHGPCVMQPQISRVFEGDFWQIERGGKTLWPGDGRLAGLMLRSDSLSGEYRIRTQKAAYRKNPRSQMQEIAPNLMLLHYPTRRIVARSQIEISMPEDQAALMQLPEDRSLLPAPALAPFSSQTLDIHGVVFWRPSNWLSRLQRILRIG